MLSPENDPTAVTPEALARTAYDLIDGDSWDDLAPGEQQRLVAGFRRLLDAERFEAGEPK